jgi:hypothetical protein
MAAKFTQLDICKATLKIKFRDVLPLPNNLHELKDRIHLAVESSDTDT